MTWRLLVLVVGLVSLAAPLTIAAPVSRVDTPQLSAVAHWLYLLDVNLSVETVGQNVVAMARKEGRDARGAMLDWVEEIARFGRDR
jgi:hypothetical protein